MSSVIGIAFLGTYAAISSMLRSMDDAGWIEFVVCAVAWLVFLGITAVWARSAVRVAVVVPLGLLLIGVERATMVPFHLDASVTADWEVSVWRDARIAHVAVLLAGAVVIWSLARRRTGYTWLGVVPATGIVVLGTWAMYDDPPFRPAGGPVVALAAILVLWGCDAVGLAVHRNRDRARAGDAPAGHTSAGHTSAGRAASGPTSVESFRTTRLYRTQVARSEDLRETERLRMPPPPLAEPIRRPDDPLFRTTQIRRPHRDTDDGRH
ncbi:hypothetical protein [Gordonia aurantiaca]|uniref:hypothetical protein n=1 Tax=Gordonia sp. B21 TaxID=3151852 RepID=UPI0032668059